MKKMTSKAMTKANGGIWPWEAWYIGACRLGWISPPKNSADTAVRDNLNNRSQYDSLIGIKH